MSEDNKKEINSPSQLSEKVSEDKSNEQPQEKVNPPATGETPVEVKVEKKEEVQKPEEIKKDALETNERPDLNPGATVRVHQKIKDVNAKGEEKERIQVFEGIIIAKHKKNDTGATITVRKISNGVGVEKIFPIHLPTIVKWEVIKQSKVRRAKLYFLREYKKRLKEIKTR